MVDNSTVFKAKENLKTITEYRQKTVMEMWKKSEEFKLELMYIYTGCRANELLQLPKANVDLINQYFKIDKSKTKAGYKNKYLSLIAFFHFLSIILHIQKEIIL